MRVRYGKAKPKLNILHWHVWFAWHPIWVKVLGSDADDPIWDIVWWEHVDRIRVYNHLGAVHWEYRRRKPARD
jgi:hypothetical protein